METLFNKIVSGFASALIFIGSIFTPAPAPAPLAPAPNLGAALPQAVGVFETSLAAPISSSATTLTLTANAIRGGGTLSGYNCFTVDEGSAQAEVLCGTVASTAVTGISRGISYANGTTTVATNQFAHRRGANVKITDFPILQILKAQNAGESEFDAPIKYNSSVSTSTLALDQNNIASVKYVTAAALDAGSVLTATESAGGFVELATGVEAASTTLSGTAGRLALPAAISTSTKPTSGHYVVVTDATGGISNFLASSTISNATLSGTTTATGVTNIASTTIRSYTASSTWAKPANLKYIIVELVGGGAGGGGANSSTNDGAGGGGGGGGGYCKNLLSYTALAATSTVNVTVGAGGAGGGSGVSGTDGGTSSFGTWCSSAGGTGGTGTTNSAAGGGGGAGTLGVINIVGGGGGAGMEDSSINNAIGGAGGNSFFGGGAPGVQGASSGNAGNTGGGGGGGSSTNNSDTSGGSGGTGIVIITEVYF